MYWEKIAGMFNFDNIYNDVIQKFNNTIFVEIGTWKGKSAVYMAEKIKISGKNIKFYTIDLFEYTPGYGSNSDSFLKEVQSNIEPVKDYINIIQGKSYEVADQFEDESIDFIFIDGDHSYLGVKKDLKSWYPKIKVGGIIAGHDYIEPSCGVKMAVDEFFLFTGISINKSSWIYKREY